MTDPQPVPQQIALQNVTANTIRIGNITQTINYTQRLKALNSVVNEGLPPLPKDALWQTRPEEKQLREYLANQEFRLIGLEGAGGYGKSAMAAKVVQTIQTDPAFGFEREPLWVNFQEPVAFGTFARWVMRKLAGEVRYDQMRETYERLSDEELLQKVLSDLTQHPCLVVMDNLETLFQSESLWEPYGDFLDGWLGRSGGGCLLLTSQYRLELPMAKVWTWLSLRGLTRSQGVALLQGEGVLGEPADLEAFVEAADGHPLLLTLAVNLLKRQEKEDLEQPEVLRLGRNAVDLLHSIVEAHRGDSEASVGKVLDASFERLYPEWLRLLLWRLSVVRQGFGLEMAQAMLDEAMELQHLRQLARWSFVQEAKADGEWRFDFLPLIARYLQLGAQEQAQTTIAHERAIAFYTNHYQPWDGTLASCQSKLEASYHACELGQYQRAYDIVNRRYEWLNWAGYRRSLLPHLTDELQAVNNEAQNLGWAGTLISNLHQSCYELLNRAGYWRSLLPLYQRLSNEWQPVNDKEIQSLGSALTRLASLYGNLGKYDQAIAHHQQVKTISEQLGEQFGIAAALGNLGTAYCSLGQYQRAIALHKQSLEIQRELGNRQGEADSLGNLGNAYNSLGQYERAIALHKQSLEIQRELGNRQDEAASLDNLGNASRFLGQYERAIALHKQHYELAQKLLVRQREAASLCNLGNAYESLGQYERAIDLYKQSLKIQRELGDRRGEAASLCGLGNVYQSLSQYQRAIELHEQYYELARELGDRRGEAISLGNLGLAYYSMGQYQRAIDFYQQRYELARKLSDRQGEANSLGNLGTAYRSLGQYQRAIDFYEQSLEIKRELGNQEVIANSLWSLANLYQQRGRIKRAMHYRHQAYQIWQTMHLPLAAAPLITFQKNIIQSMGDDWAEQMMTNEKTMAWLFLPMGYLLFALRALLSPLINLQKRLKIPPLLFWFGIGLVVVILIGWLKR